VNVICLSISWPEPARNGHPRSYPDSGYHGGCRIASNIFAYVDGNPLILVDSEGLQAVPAPLGAMPLLSTMPSTGEDEV